MIPVCKRPDLTVDFSKWIFIKENYLPHDICDDLISYSDINAMHIKSKVWPSNFLTCGVLNNHYIHEKLSDVWEEAINFFESSITFIEEYNVNKYGFGDYFSSHIDNYRGLTNKLDRKLTFSLQLSHSSDYGAGDFKVEGMKMPRTKGSVVIFPSNFKHAVNGVGYGTRYSLFTWAWGPAF
jgi:hypothetical protein